MDKDLIRFKYPDPTEMKICILKRPFLKEPDPKP